MTDAERAIVKQLYQAKAERRSIPAYCTAAQPLTMHRWNGKHPSDENTTIETVPAGTTLRIVMVSRLGDCGLTDDLEAEHGYQTRADWESGLISDIRLTREPTR